MPASLEFASSLRPTYFLDFNEPYLRAWVQTVLGPHRERLSARQVAIQLFYAVRDGIRYDPYHLYLKREEARASVCLHKGYGYCVVKALLLAAAFRSQGLPSRLGFANVRNHLTTGKMLAALRTDVFAFHGYVEVLLDDTWIKVTPTFNVELCTKFGVKPLEWDGYEDCLYHAYDQAGERHMEYISDLGVYDDLPYDRMIAELRKHYPHVFTSQGALFNLEGDFILDAASEADRHSESSLA